MKGFATATIALVSTLLLAGQAGATCSTSSPVNAGVAIDAVTEIYNGGTWDGTYQLKGSADCDASNTLAMASALALPAWLGDKENFSLSGGLGFSDDATAVGVTGIARINGGLSAFAGGAVGEDDQWAARAGLRVGW
jgi:hypothetical protein